MAWDVSKFKKPSAETLKNVLTPEQYSCSQGNGTEAPFKNKYWDHHEPGIYIDVVSEEPLFSSTDKFESGSGWPSFTKPIENKNVVRVEDKSAGLSRTEVRSKHGDSHLGHVFDDGPKDKGGQRFCINSASLKFVHLKDMERKGYGNYVELFPKELRLKNGLKK